MFGEFVGALLTVAWDMFPYLLVAFAAWGIAFTLPSKLGEIAHELRLLRKAIESLASDGEEHSGSDEDDEE